MKSLVLLREVGKREGTMMIGRGKGKERRNVIGETESIGRRRRGRRNGRRRRIRRKEERESSTSQ